MGAWGVGSFENDDALDWLAAFREHPDEASVRETLTLIGEAEEDSFLDAADCADAIAAAETVAAARGRPLEVSLPDDGVAFLTGLRFAGVRELTQLALRALDRIRTDQNCELHDLWREAEEEEARSEWLAAVEELRERLR
jgi:hypothetical protein